MEKTLIPVEKLPLTETGSADVLRIPTAFVNTYAVGDPRGEWVLVDTGLPNFSAYVNRIAMAYTANPPSAIILTHGHFDHAGNALALAEEWNVPVYAHSAEIPFLNGTSDYPPGDPSMGGAIAQLSRAFPSGGFDLGNRLRVLSADGSVPHLPDWRWLHTPGHTPGHVSLWRESDRFLIAGDALATMDLDSWVSQFTHSRELARSPVPFTPDWGAAETSLRELAELRPRTLAAGHGRIMSDPTLADRLFSYAAKNHRPQHGRYAGEPARFDEERGVVGLPPDVEDKSLPWLVGGLAIVGLAIGAIAAGTRNKQ